MSNRERMERWHTIEGKHFGQCVWQQRGSDGRSLMEGLVHRATGHILIVQKFYEERLPRMNSSKPWPELETVKVYAEVDFQTNTWDGLDKALEELHAGNKAA